MNIDPGKNDLLEDVLQEAAPPDFRSELLMQILGEARHQRVRRARNRALASSAFVVLLIAVTARLLLIPSKPPTPKTDPLLVHSQTLGPDVLMATVPGAILLVHSAGTSVAVVETVPSERLFSVIGETELFSLLAGRPAVLVCRGPQDCDLVLLNPEDRNGFRIP